jgi:hypothetical protein
VAAAAEADSTGSEERREQERGSCGEGGGEEGRGDDDVSACREKRIACICVSGLLVVVSMLHSHDSAPE